MRRLTWMMALSMVVIMPSLGSGAAEATPDRSGLTSRAASDGWERTPRFLSGRAPKRDAGKRCERCGGAARVDRMPLPGSGEPSIPEPSAALLFGSGLLALRPALRNARVR